LTQEWELVRSFDVTVAPFSKFSNGWYTRAVDLLDSPTPQDLLPGLYRVSALVPPAESESSEFSAQLLVETPKSHVFRVLFEESLAETCRLHGHVLTAKLLRSDFPTVHFSDTVSRPYRLAWSKPTKVRVEVLMCNSTPFTVNTLSCCPSAIDRETGTSLFLVHRDLQIHPLFSSTQESAALARCQDLETAHLDLHHQPTDLTKVVVEMDLPTRLKGRISLRLSFGLKTGALGASVARHDWLVVETPEVHLLPPPQNAVYTGSLLQPEQLDSTPPETVIPSNSQIARQLGIPFTTGWHNRMTKILQSPRNQQLLSGRTQSQPEESQSGAPFEQNEAPKQVSRSDKRTSRWSRSKDAKPDINSDQRSHPRAPAALHDFLQPTVKPHENPYAILQYRRKSNK
jgi:hypothetical protein